MANDRAGDHLWQVDVVRLLTFMAVIAVHAIAFTQLPSGNVAAGALMLLQFGREVFFSLSAFVLVYAALGRPTTSRSFWRRRFPLVAVPYVAWSAIYVMANDVATGTSWSWGGFGTDLLWGGAEYHLYFLLVTLQLYLAFPVLLWFVRRTAAWAGRVLAVVIVANLAWLAALQYVPAGPGPLAWIYSHAYELLPTYSLYVLAGAYAAMHFERAHRFTMRHARGLLAVAGGAAGVAVLAYVAQLPNMAPRQAAAVLQPATAASCLAALIVIYLVGTRWASGRCRAKRLVATGSEISFGVYLAHPLILLVLLDNGLGNGRQVIPSTLATVLAFAGATVGASVLALAVRRTPLASVLLGRPRRRSLTVGRPSRVNSSASAPAATGGRARPGTEPHVAALLAAAARRDPEREVFIEGATGRVLTAGDLSQAAARWRGIAESVGDVRVGLAISDPLDMISAYLGALAAGVTVAPMDPGAAPAEHAAALGRLGISALVTDQPEAAGGAALAGCRVWPVRDLGLVGPEVGRSGDQPRGRGAALIMASSGTTGAAKTIPLSEAQLLATARQVANHLALGPAERGYSPLPLFHINALVVGVLACVCAGASLVVDRRFSHRAFWPTVDKYHVTWLNLVPGIISMLAEAPGGPPAAAVRRVRLARSASAPLAVATLDRFERRTGIPVVETYGMTEAASQITANPVGARRRGSVGLPAGVAVRVTGPDGRPEPAGSIGMVSIAGESVAEEYWGPADQPTSPRPARSGDGWLVTGDLGHFDQDGYLYLDGRADDVINRSGEKIHPRQIEEILLRDPGVVSAGVVGRPHPIHGEEPVAFVVAASGVDAVDLLARLAGRCEQSLSRHKRPVDIVIAESLPTGPTGKVKRAALRPVGQMA